MIIFNNLGHTFIDGEDDSKPIIWVDSSDTSTYTLSGNDVTSLLNKGTLGGVMTLNGSVKFANNGFESWSSSDYITRDLVEPFLTDNSFTIVTTFDLQNITSGNISSLNWFSTLYGDDSNIFYAARDNTFMINGVINSATPNSYGVPYNLELQTVISTYNLSNNQMILLNYNGNYSTKTISQFDNTINAIQYILKSGRYSSNSGANNPLHEFRLYKRAFDLTEMQDLQTELNNKYSKPIVWVDSSDSSTYTLSGNDVLTLDNKGTLGGAMTLNGAVKFANNGFESWVSGTCITRDLGEPFKPDNSFTISATFDLQDLTLTSTIYDFQNGQYGSNSNRVGGYKTITSTIQYAESVPNGYSKSNNNVLGLQTILMSYNIDLQTISFTDSLGNQSEYFGQYFDNTDDSLLSLLESVLFPGQPLGANNPLHEFRLYNRAMSLTQMQDLQTELNNKYTP